MDYRNNSKDSITVIDNRSGQQTEIFFKTDGQSNSIVCGDFSITVTKYHKDQQTRHYKEDWKCSNCGYLNFGSRSKCNSCSTVKIAPQQNQFPYIASLPREVLRQIISKANPSAIFRVCKLFASFQEDEEFWAEIVRTLCRNPSLKDVSEAPRLRNVLSVGTTWKHYCYDYYRNEAKRRAADIYVKSPTGNTVTIYAVDLTKATVGELKRKLTPKTGISPHMQRLVFAGKRLDDDFKLLEYYGIGSECTLHHII